MANSENVSRIEFIQCVNSGDRVADEDAGELREGSGIALHQGVR